MTATKSDRVTDMAGARLLVVAFVAVALLVVVVATHVKQATSGNWPTTTGTTTSNKFGAIASRSREK